MLRLQATAWYTGLAIAVCTFLWTLMVLADSHLQAWHQLIPRGLVIPISYVIPTASKSSAIGASALPDSIQILAASFQSILVAVGLSVVLLMIGSRRFRHEAQ
jgi:hypothetical protein